MAKAATPLVAFSWRLVASRWRSPAAAARGRNSRRRTSPASAFGRDFALTDHNGKARTLADFRGKVVVLFFGYTQCPDVCPTTLSDARGGDAAPRAGRGARAGAVRDDRSGARHGGAPVALRAGVRSVVPRARRATPRPRPAPRRNSRSSTRSSRAATPGSYTMDHSAGTFIFDPEGRLRLYAGHGQDADVFAHDLAPAAARRQVVSAARPGDAARPQRSGAPRRSVALPALDQLDLVAVGILHERDDRRAALHRTRVARDGAADPTAARTAAHVAAASSTSIAT